MKRALLLGLVVVSAAGLVTASSEAKTSLRITVPPAIRSGHDISVVVRAAEPLQGQLRLVAVAPNASVMDVVARATGSGVSAGNAADPPRDGFVVLTKRVSKTSWRVRLRLGRPGLWRLVVPNWSLNGYAMPLPLVKAVRVTR